MSIFEGRLLNLESVDSRNRKFSQDCKITFPERVSIYYIFQHYFKPIGKAEIQKDENGLTCKCEFPDDSNWLKFIEDGSGYCYVGGEYYDVESHEDDGIIIIDSCRLESMSVMPELFASDKTQKIRRINNDT